MCFELGLLQAFLDNELDHFRKDEIRKHLVTCVSCQKKLKQLTDNQKFTDGLVLSYLNTVDNPNRDMAWDHLKKHLIKTEPSIEKQPYPWKGVINVMKKYRHIAVAASVTLAVVVSLSFAPVRAMASELLSIFRVNNFQTVTITPDDLAKVKNTLGKGAGKVTLGNLGQVEMKRTGENGHVTLAEAKESVDFPLLLPQALPSGTAIKDLQRAAGTSLNFTLDTNKTNDVLKNLGATTLLPDSLNGKTFSAVIPVVISARYSGPQNLTISQTRSPQLTAPNESDINTIRDAILALPFLPSDLRRQLASINDWQHTFVIPNLKGSAQNTTVAGSQGVYISAPQAEQNTGASVHNALLWQKNGVIYAVTGNFTLEQGLVVANSMK